MIQLVQEQAIDGRMKSLHAWVAIVTAADETGLEIDVNQLGRDTVRETQPLTLCRRDNGFAPLAVGSIDVQRGR